MKPPLLRQQRVVGSTRAPLDGLLLPSSIAVVGASDRPGSVGLLALAAARRGFDGPVYAVNPKRTELLGEPAYPNLSALPSVPDLVVVCVPAALAVTVAADSASLGVPGLLVFSSGFAETGDAGRRRQDELAAAVAGTRTRLLGPNSLGFFDAGRGALATFLFSPTSPAPKPGALALVSQSGGFAEQLVARADQADLGMTWMISTGNELDVTLTDGFEFLLGRPEAETIVLFAESIKDPQRFMAAARRARARGRTVIVVKTGRSTAGARAAITHTASMAGSERVFAQACRDLGLIRAHTLDDVVDIARLVASRRHVSGRRLAVVTASGGGGVLAADLADDAGLEVPLLSEGLQATLRATLPAFGTTSNPVDVTAQGADDPAAFRSVLDVVTGSGEVDALACVFSTHGPVAVEVARTIVAAYTDTTLPFVAVWGSPEPASRQVFDSAGLPWFGNPRNALQALGAVARAEQGQVDEEPMPIGEHRAADCPVCRAPGRIGLVLETEAQAFLAAYGISSARSRTVTTAAAAEAAVTELGSPVAMKLISPAVPHREKAGAISLGVTSPDQARAQLDRLSGLVPADVSDWSVTVQEQVPRGLEVVVGAQRDPDWGPTVLVGLGGTQTELIDRTALRLAPASGAVALGAVRDVFGTHLSAETTWAVAEVVQRVSRGLIEHPRLDSIDVNPLIVTPQGLVAVDGLLSLSPRPPADPS